jgi:hypothetical protein
MEQRERSLIVPFSSDSGVAPPFCVAYSKDLLRDRTP